MGWDLLVLLHAHEPTHPQIKSTNHAPPNQIDKPETKRFGDGMGFAGAAAHDASGALAVAALLDEVAGPCWAPAPSWEAR